MADLEVDTDGEVALIQTLSLEDTSPSSKSIMASMRWGAAPSKVGECVDK